jgi:hypothetical protein
MLNVRDECDLPEDDGYDLFTRETEVERRRKSDARPKSPPPPAQPEWGTLETGPIYKDPS